MSRLAIVSAAAERDLVRIYDHIAEDSGRAASRMIDRLRRRFDEIAESPELGRQFEELEMGLKRANEGVYAVFYRVGEDVVEIARVIHGMRDLPARFRG